MVAAVDQAASCSTRKLHRTSCDVSTRIVSCREVEYEIRLPKGVISDSLHLMGRRISFTIISSLPPMQSAFNHTAPASTCTVPAAAGPLVGGTVNSVVMPGWGLGTADISGVGRAACVPGIDALGVDGASRSLSLSCVHPATVTATASAAKAARYPPVRGFTLLPLQSGVGQGRLHRPSAEDRRSLRAYPPHTFQPIVGDPDGIFVGLLSCVCCHGRTPTLDRVDMYGTLELSSADIKQFFEELDRRREGLLGPDGLTAPVEMNPVNDHDPVPMFRVTFSDLELFP